MMTEEEMQALLEYVDEKKKDRARIKFELDLINEEIEKAELQLQNYLELNKIEGYKQSGIFSFGWKITERKTFNQKAFGEDYPELLEKYKLPQQSRKFQILINGR